MTIQQALDLINTVDSRHQSAQPLLRKMVRGEEVTDDEVNAFCDNDSRYENLRPVLRAIADGKALDEKFVTDHCDSFSEPIEPLLVALAQGLQPAAA